MNTQDKQNLLNICEKFFSEEKNETQIITDELIISYKGMKVPTPGLEIKFSLEKEGAKFKGKTTIVKVGRVREKGFILDCTGNIKLFIPR